MKLNKVTKSNPVFTHEGGPAQRVSPLEELRRAVITCLLWEDNFYESGNSLANRIAELVPKVNPGDVAELAILAREHYLLRHAPLWLVRQLARVKGQGTLVANTLASVIQRPDELGEFLALYWKDKRQPLSAGVKRGLAAAFQKFNEYSLAKYNRDSEVKLRDVLFLCHAKPTSPAQEKLWKRLIDGKLETPDTWEVELSKGSDKKSTWERLLKEDKLGGLAVLRNLRNMQQAGVDVGLIRSRLEKGISKALPFRFIAAARYAPSLEADIEKAMFKASAGLDPFEGNTGLLIDVSGSMDLILSSKSEMTRLEAANALAILLRERCENVRVGTFSYHFKEVPGRRGFALRDAVTTSQAHQGTSLARSTKEAQNIWKDLDRLIVITDEQSQDGFGPAFAKENYCVNVAPYNQGLSYGNGWTHINGWSERVLDFIEEYK